MPVVTIDNKSVAKIIRVGANFAIYKDDVFVVSFGYPRPLLNAKGYCDRRGWPYQVLKGTAKKEYVQKLLKAVQVYGG